MKKISAQIIADSISPQGHRITSYILTYPRFIHSEMMTHRMFSRNAASSRAIPFEKMLKMIEEDPFIPIAWQKDHKGMQGTEYFTEEWIDFGSGKIGFPKEFDFEVEDSDDLFKLVDVFRYDWGSTENCSESALSYVIDSAKRLHSMGVTKQICNRLLEPFMWYTNLVTATEFDNFFELRCPKYKLIGLGGGPVRSRKDWLNRMKFSSMLHPNQYPKTEEEWWKLSESGAEIHIQALAEAIWDARNESTPKQLQAGEWHIPFGDRIELPSPIPIPEGLTLEEGVQFRKVMIATARCARLSYMTFDGEIDYAKDIILHDTLLNSRHMSPFEHCAKAMSDIEYYSFYKGMYPTCEEENGDIFNYETYPKYYSDYLGEHGWANNFRGFIPYRYLIENNK